MSEQMREEFEAAYLDSCGFKPQNWNGLDYLHAHANGAWWAWQASSAALCVELPDSVASTGTLTSSAVLAYKRECRDAIHAAGVKTK